MNTISRTLARSCAAVLTVAATALLGSAAAQDAAAQSEDPTVLQAGDYVETRSELNERFEIAIRGLAASQGLQLNDAIRAQLEAYKPGFLEQRAAEVALLQEAEERGITISDEEVDDLIEQVRGTLPEGAEFSDFLEQAGFRDEEHLRGLVRETESVQRTVDAIESEIEVTASEVEEFYGANQELFEEPEQVCARHILVETVEEAEQAMADLEAGGDFSAIADERSLDTGTQGGDLGCFTRGRMVPPFEEAAFGAPVDEPVGPVESQFGQHVILVYDRQEAGVAPLEQVSSQIEEQLRGDKLGEAITDLREQHGVETFPDRLGVAPAPETAPQSAPEPTETPEEAPQGDETETEPEGEENRN